MNKTIKSAFGLFLLLPVVAFGQTTSFSGDIQVTGSAKIGSAYITGFGTGDYPNIVDGSIFGYPLAQGALMMGESNWVGNGGAADILLVGSYNVSMGSLGCSVLGFHNTLRESSYSTIIGWQNSTNSMGGVSGIFEIGNNLSFPQHSDPLVPINMMIFGFYNASMPLGQSPEDLNSALFVIGNGTSSSATSNALVMLKNGHTSLTNIGYLPPETPVPSPMLETFVVNGDSTLNGAVHIPPSGDLSMGSFTSSPTP